jgi:outer membrane lipoprotein-sorting protein
MRITLCLTSLGMLLAQPQPSPPPSPSPATTQAGATAPAEDPAFIRRLEAIDARAAGINDLTAEFEQRRHTPLLKRPLVSSGRVRLKGTTIRWDTRAPSKSVLVINAESLWIFYPQQRTLEIYPMESGLARLAASPLPRLQAVRDQFIVHECKVSELDGVTADSKAPAVAVLLVPRSEELKKYVREVRVLLDEPAAEGQAIGTEGGAKDRQDRPYGVARQIEVTDGDGDRTVVVFKEIRTNTGLKDSDLELTVPEGTRVSHPLEGAGTRDGPARKDRK